MDEGTIWRSIESAPKDGALLIGFHGGFVGVIRWASKFSGEYYGNSEPGWYSDILDRRVEPTHWMHLPAPPTAETAI